MRLLHTEKLFLKEFFDRDMPKYAILSHRWEEAEVSYQDIEEGKKKDCAGYRKITDCCNLAKSQGYGWVWIDTCCIDKKSSSEVSEAINSMYRWYANSEICYAYLSDVQCPTVNGRGVPHGFEESKWFTRGWTLQELLAPSQVLFLDQSWKALGTKNRQNETKEAKCLSHILSEITGIPQKILELGLYGSYWQGPTSLSVAQRMSWASKRETSRLEDMAYCLLGIFNINMSLLYGEGDEAFIRLQQEIIKKSEDESIFAWCFNIEPTRPDGFDPNLFQRPPSLFARSPSAFAKSGNVERWHHYSWIGDSPYGLTDLGVKVDVLLIPGEDEKTWLLPLNCETQGRRNAIVLRKLHDNHFRREVTTVLDFVDKIDVQRYLNELEDGLHTAGEPSSRSFGQLTSTSKAKRKRSSFDERASFLLQREFHGAAYKGAGAKTASDIGSVRRIYILNHHDCLCQRDWGFGSYGWFGEWCLG